MAFFYIEPFAEKSTNPLRPVVYIVTADWCPMCQLYKLEDEKKLEADKEIQQLAEVINIEIVGRGRDSTAGPRDPKAKMPRNLRQAAPWLPVAIMAVTDASDVVEGVPLAHTAKNDLDVSYHGRTYTVMGEVNTTGKPIHNQVLRFTYTNLKEWILGNLKNNKMFSGSTTKPRLVLEEREKPKKDSAKTTKYVCALSSSSD